MQLSQNLAEGTELNHKIPDSRHPAPVPCTFNSLKAKITQIKQCVPQKDSAFQLYTAIC
jgi:hypothetical protein